MVLWLQLEGCSGVDGGLVVGTSDHVGGGARSRSDSNEYRLPESGGGSNVSSGGSGGGVVCLPSTLIQILGWLSSLSRPA